jgi:hypothetical protein
VIVLDALLRGKVIVNQTSANALDLVGANRRPNAAAANGDAAIHFARHDGLSERNNEVGIIVVRSQRVSAEVHDFMARRANPGNQFFLQTKPAVIGGNANAHVFFVSVRQFPRRLTIGEDQGVFLADSPGGNRHVAIAQAHE